LQLHRQSLHLLQSPTRATWRQHAASQHFFMEAIMFSLIALLFAARRNAVLGTQVATVAPLVTAANDDVRTAAVSRAA
jgi:hypothetical protein